MKKSKKTKGGSISSDYVTSLINGDCNIVDAYSKHIDWNSVINPEIIKNNYGIGYSTTGGRVAFPSRYFDPKRLKKKSQKGGNIFNKIKCSINTDNSMKSHQSGPPDTNIPKGLFEKAVNMFLGYEDSQLFQPSESNVSYNKFSPNSAPKYNDYAILNRNNSENNEQNKADSNMDYKNQMDHTAHSLNNSPHKHIFPEGDEHNHAMHSQKINNDLNLNLNSWMKPLKVDGISDGQTYGNYRLFDDTNLAIGKATESTIPLLGAGKKSKKQKKKNIKKK